MSEQLLAKVLIVDDEEDWRSALADVVRSAGFELILAASGDEALKHLSHEPVFLVLADLVMPGMDGLELCRAVRSTNAELSFILVTGKADRAKAIEGFRSGITDIVDKPFSGESLRTVIKVHASKYLEAIEQSRREAATLLAIFLDEAREQMRGVTEGLLRLEQEPGDMGEIDSLFRKIHTIKGSSGAVKKAEKLAPLAHAIETVLNLMKQGKLTISAAVIDGLLEATDLLAEQILAIEGNLDLPDGDALIARLGGLTSKDSSNDAPPPPSQTERPGKTPKQEQDSGVYVTAETLDALMETAGELIAAKNAFQTLYRDLGSASKATRTSAKELGEALQKVSERFQSQLMDARKVSLKNVFAKLPRIVRQVCAEIGKDVALEMAGGDVTVDKTVANVLSGCLSHAVRNSLDHGMEPAAERMKNGKPARGRVVVKAENKQEFVEITVYDDGGGIDREKVIRKAVEQGLIRDGENLTDGEVFQLIFHPGFSTAAAVTNVSGRGVGMDAIQSAISSCNGTTKILSTKGEGTTLVLEIPVLKTINVERALLVESTGTLYALPLKGVSTITKVKANELLTLKEHLTFQYMGKATRLASYGELVGKGQQRGFEKKEAWSDERLVVVVTSMAQYLGLEIDRIVGQFDAVIRPLNRLVGQFPGFEGTAVVGSGKIAYVLSADEMVKVAAGQLPVA